MKNSIVLVLKKYKLKQVKMKGSNCPGGNPYIPVRTDFGF